jgi:hypothetical protein
MGVENGLWVFAPSNGSGLRRKRPASQVLWIESSETVHNIREFYPMPILEAGLVRARRGFTKNWGMLRKSDAIRFGVHPPVAVGELR